MSNRPYVRPFLSCPSQAAQEFYIIILFFLSYWNVSATFLYGNSLSRDFLYEILYRFSVLFFPFLFFIFLFFSFLLTLLFLFIYLSKFSTSPISYFSIIFLRHCFFWLRMRFMVWSYNRFWAIQTYNYFNKLFEKYQNSCLSRYFYADL